MVRRKKKNKKENMKKRGGERVFPCDQKSFWDCPLRTVNFFGQRMRKCHQRVGVRVMGRGGFVFHSDSKWRLAGVDGEVIFEQSSF
ncbi:hypothetical protein NPIL_568541 [Nephila pilipes]|uniref:Uncharacterized protein n=1 Tax=Nephila pilipes TaxID=299642 RepID=A0A8X6MQM6_NEPPI|nr:hypothetical protein NPIL_568541 [Nephila pilipes]